MQVHARRPCVVDKTKINIPLDYYNFVESMQSYANDVKYTVPNKGIRRLNRMVDA